MGLGYSALHTYLPYTKVIYKMSEISQNAERDDHSAGGCGEKVERESKVNKVIYPQES